MDIPPDLIITAADIRKAGHCIVPGTKRWFADHGLDFRSFIKNGIAAETLLATGDALANQVVERTRARRDG